MSMCTEIPGRTVSAHYPIPTGFVVDVLGPKSGVQPTRQPPVGNHMFAVTSAAATARMATAEKPRIYSPPVTAPFHLCPLMRIREAFRYFWPNKSKSTNLALIPVPRLETHGEN